MSRLETGGFHQDSNFAVHQLQYFVRIISLDTPQSKDTGILGSTRPLKLDSLRYLTQRWDSPQALTFGLPDRSCMTASPVEYETIRFKILIRVSTSLNTSLAPINLLPTARKKLEQYSRTAQI